MKTTHAGLWNRFKAANTLTDEQVEQFKRYQDLLIAWNKRMNLTAITKPEAIVSLHFQDSLEIAHAVDMGTINSVADIGTGAGFPGLAIKIKYPDKALYLIEVNQKKVAFLEHVVRELGLSGVEIYQDDWRTFLRHASGSVDLFCARASLQPEELVRMFRPSSSYAPSSLVYWASESWHPSAQVEQFVQEEYRYQIGDKKRKLVVMKAS